MGEDGCWGPSEDMALGKGPKGLRGSQAITGGRGGHSRQGRGMSQGPEAGPCVLCLGTEESVAEENRLGRGQEGQVGQGGRHPRRCSAGGPTAQC